MIDALAYIDQLAKVPYVDVRQYNEYDYEPLDLISGY